MKLSRLLGATALAGTLLATTATAQTTSSTTPVSQTDEAAGSNPNANPTQEASQASGEIIVTGSRIPRPNLDSSVPITSISIGDITNTGNVILGDRLNELPSLRPTLGQSNSISSIGTAALNVLDLRGLGTARTLVVVNGRRHVTSVPGSNSVDVNTIPTDLLERVDVITGGNSAVYGSDAVAGVVNFVLKRDFEGFRLRTQGAVTDRGDRGQQFISATAGHNFADGRGNIAVSGEFARAEAVYFSQREEQYGAFRGRDQFNLTENTLGEPSTGNGIPDQSFLRNVRNISISTGGAFVSTCPTTAATGETAAGFAARRALTCTGLFTPTNPGAARGAELGRGFVFDASGNLVANNGTSDLRTVGSGNNIAGLGSTLRETGQLLPGFTRYAANVVAHFDVSDAFRPFFESKVVRIDAVQEGQASFFTNTFNINNPFLSSQARSTLVQALAPNATSFTTTRFNVDFAGRGEQHRRDTVRFVAGVDGTFNGDWRYEVSANYGRLETKYNTRGNVLLAEYGRSVNAVLAPSTFTGQNFALNAAGQRVVCAVNADASTANDDARCVPVNLFGNGAANQAALDYFGYESTRVQRAEQYNAVGFISGDLSQLFELPGGPIGFALGGEYRRETAYAKYDTPTQSGLTFLNAIAEFRPPALEVKEAFGEIRVPLLRDKPFFHELLIEGAARVSDYNLGTTGTVWAYNAGGIWSPFRGLRLRGSYARSVRAPTQANLALAGNQTFLLVSDPCGQQNINNNPNRVRNCAAAGVPTTQTFNGVTEPFTNRPANSILGLNGSNPNLNEERGTSYTIGGVFQPDFAPGLAITVDYYNITVKNVIFSLGGQTIIDQCYDNPSGTDNPFCSAITRNPNGTFAGQDSVLNGGTTVTFPRTGTSFISGPFNYAQQKTAGIDADVSYRHSFGNDKVLNLRAVASYLIRRDNYTDILRPDFINQQKLELGDPEWRGTFTANMDFGPFDVNYRFRYVGKQTIGTFEAQNSLQGRPPENPDQFPQVYYPDITYSDIRIGVDLPNQSQFFLGVDNMFDRLPPFGLTGSGGDAIYDVVGRSFYAGVQVRF